MENVAFLTGEGQYGTANKRARLNALLFDLQRNPVLVPGRSKDALLRINISESDASDPAMLTSAVRIIVKSRSRVSWRCGPQPATKHPGMCPEKGKGKDEARPGELGTVQAAGRARVF